MPAEIPNYDPFRDAGDCRFDEEAAKLPLDFFAECLQFIEGEQAGKPFRLEKWQQAIIANIFGWKRPDGTRRYREVFIYVPRKNGKTPLIAGIVLFAGFCGKEPGAQIYSAAADQAQAALIFRHARGMIEVEPELASRAKVYHSFKSIEFPNNGLYKALSAEAYTKHGLNSQLVVFDEVHSYPDRELVDVLLTSTGSRREPLVIYITTADFHRESICNEKYDYACKVRDGIIQDPAFLPVIYEAGEDDDWTAEETWRKANPNLGVSVSLEYLRRECQRAQDTPSYENTFKRLHLNIVTEQDVRWLNMEQWDSAGDANPKSWRERQLAALHKRSCYGGLDLGATKDLTAFVLLFDSDEGFILLPYFWVPEVSARERELRDRVPYTQWIRDGWIKPTSGNSTDFDCVRRDIVDLAKTYGIKGVGADRLFQGDQLITQLREQDGLNVVAFGMGFASMAAPTKKFEELVLNKKILHGGNPVLRWMAANVTVEMDAAGNIKPSKKKSTERIDGIVASIMAAGMRMADQKPDFVYGRRGLTII